MLHTWQLISPDVLFILSWVIGVVGVICCIVALHGMLMRNWNTHRLLAWMLPVTLSQMMDRFGWWPLIATIAVFAGCWLWTLLERRIDMRPVS